MGKGFGREYPKGRLNADDEGQTQVGIAADHDHKRVIINYFKPVVWIGLDFDSGLAILRSLAEKLSEIAPVSISVTIAVKEAEDAE